MQNYIFTSTRLGLRTWRQSDLAPFSAMNADREVMKYFPKTLSTEESQNFINRMNQMYNDSGYCYYAVDELISRNFIGFIGISDRSLPFLKDPQIDIGWRIALPYWNKGFATEGAKAVLQYAGHELGIQQLISIATEGNSSSIHVMKKIGMQFQQYFDFDALKDFPNLKKCVLYQIRLTV